HARHRQSGSARRAEARGRRRRGGGVMEGILFLFGLVGVAWLLGPPIASAILFGRTRALRQRMETLEAELHELRGALRPGEAPARDGPEAHEAHKAPEAREVPEVRQVSEVREAHPSPVVHVTPPAPAPPAAPAAEAPLAAAAPRAADLRAREPESLETRIGARWLLYIGVVAIVIGVSYFEKLAIDYGWIGETARGIQGAVVGRALRFGGTRVGERG